MERWDDVIFYSHWELSDSILQLQDSRYKIISYSSDKLILKQVTTMDSLVLIHSSL